jgi:hypothetical protein
MLHVLTDINIGLSPEMCDSKRQGIARFADHTGEVYKQPFLVDKPSRVEKPSSNTLDTLFGQIRKMGFKPVSLEFINERRHAIYHPDNGTPVFFQPLTH